MQEKFNAQSILEILQDTDNTPEARMERVETAIRENNFDVNTHDANGLTLLHHAIMEGVSSSLLEYILRDLHANPNIPIGENFRQSFSKPSEPASISLPPLHLAINYSSGLATVAMLVKYGAEVNAQDRNDNQPMDLCIKALLCMNGSSHIMDSHMFIMRFLDQCGAILNTQTELLRAGKDLSSQIDTREKILFSSNSSTSFRDKLVSRTAHVQLSREDWGKALTNARQAAHHFSGDENQAIGSSSHSPSRAEELCAARAIVADNTLHSLLQKEQESDKAFRETAEKRFCEKNGTPSSSPKKEERRGSFISRVRPNTQRAPSSPLQTLRRGISHILHRKPDENGEGKEASRGK